MIVSTHFKNTILELMQKGNPAADPETVELAKTAGVLLIGFDLCNNMYIHPSGLVGGNDAFNSTIQFAEQSPASLISALKFGAAQFPALSDLIPSRPDEAIVCHQCKGTGTHPVAQNTHCDDCGGVGWVAEYYEF